MMNKFNKVLAFTLLASFGAAQGLKHNAKAPTKKNEVNINKAQDLNTLNIKIETKEEKKEQNNSKTILQKAWDNKGKIALFGLGLGLTVGGLIWAVKTGKIDGSTFSTLKNKSFGNKMCLLSEKPVNGTCPTTLKMAEKLQDGSFSKQNGKEFNAKFINRVKNFAAHFTDKNGLAQKAWNTTGVKPLALAGTSYAIGTQHDKIVGGVTSVGTSVGNGVKAAYNKTTEFVKNHPWITAAGLTVVGLTTMYLTGCYPKSLSGVKTVGNTVANTYNATANYLFPAHQPAFRSNIAKYKGPINGAYRLVNVNKTAFKHSK